MNIEVKNCHECPFVNNDNKYGKDSCNLDDNIFTEGFGELPKDDVHKDCPLKINAVTVSITK
jgi:hypothetical protein